jgi:L-iditol 2-dehydrogenase
MMDMPVPHPGENEVVLRVHYSGVSVGTEMWLVTGRIDYLRKPPFITGYQACGEIVEIGAKVTGLKVGDLVAAFCSSGSHAQYAKAPAGMAHKIADASVAQQAGLFVQPSVAANALNQAQVNTGDTVLVVGQGLIGQATAMLARLRGAYVVASDIAPVRLDFSNRYCADWVIDASRGPVAEQMKPRFPDGFDVVMETTGFQELIDGAASCCRAKGRFVFEGHYPGNVTFRFPIPHSKQVRAFFPCFIGDPPVREGVLRLMESRKLDLAPLITHPTPWNQAQALYARLLGKERNDFNGIVFDWR